MSTLHLIEPDDDGNAFLCQICLRSADGSADRARFRSANTSSNLYSHFKHVHSEVFSILEPLIKAKVNNKRRRLDNPRQGTIETMVVRSQERTFDECLLQFFAAPDIPKNVLEHCRFQNLIKAANSNLKTPTVKTLNSRLWTKFNTVIESIKQTVQSAEFLTFMFDGWSTARSEAVLGCMVTTIDEQLLMVTKPVGNFRLSGRHTAADVCNVLQNVIQKRLGGRRPTYFVSDSAPVNKAAVRMLMQDDDGDDHWYPCAVHFCQLAMKEAVTSFLSGEDAYGAQDDIDWDELDYEGLIHQANLLATSSAFERLTHTARAIRATLRRSNVRMERFTILQTSLGIFKTIASDVPTRFDSTINMFESILVNKPVLLRLQELGRRDADSWPLALHLTADDFELIKHVVSILDPVRAATRDLSSARATVADVVPTFTWTIDAVRLTDAPSSAEKLKISLLNSLITRLKMLLGTEEPLPSIQGQKYSTVLPNEYVISSYLSPRYHQAMKSFYGYSERAIVTEMSRILQDLSNEDESESESDKDQSNAPQPVLLPTKAGVQSWIDRASRGRDSSVSRGRARKQSMRAEYAQFCSEVSQKRYSESSSREFWINANKHKTFPRLSLLARMFMTVPASAIPQERHFSELRRRCGALRTRSKIETLDRDAVVYSWIDDSAVSQ